MELGIEGLDRATKIETLASSILYRARQIDLDREVAVKVLSDTDETFVSQFSHEAKALGKLGQHQNVVTVYDTGVTTDGHPYLIVELCQSSVEDQLEEGPLEAQAAAAAGAQIADALAEAHRIGIPHGAIRPENILIGQTGRYVVTDFGLGPAATDRTGVAAADPYRAPEAGPGHEATAAGDVYALGATLFHLVVGTAPGTGSDNDAGNGSPVTTPELPGEIDDIIEAAMAPDPTDRPTAAAIRDQLLLFGGSNGATGPLIGGFEMVSGGSELALAGSTTTVADAPMPPTGPLSTSGSAPPPPSGSASAPGLAPPAPPSPPMPEADTESGLAMTTGSNWLAPPPDPQNGAAGSGQTAGLSDQRILEARPSNAGIQLGAQRELPTRFEEGPSRNTILALSIIGLFVLLGTAAFLLLRGDDDVASDDDVNVEAVDGPSTSLDANQNEAGGGGGNGAVGSLQAGGDQDGGETDDTGSQSTDRTGTTSRPATVPRIAVPDVTGSGAAAAEQQLERLGFTVTRLTEPSTTIAPGDVIRLNPQSGALLERGGTVTMIVAVAPPVETVVIPATVVGATETEATATLTALGLTSIGPTVTEPSQTVATGIVIRVSPADGASVELDDTVTLVVSSGPPAAPECSTVIGLTEAEATTRFEAANVTVTSGPADHATIPVGSVTSCSVDGQTASLLISSGPPADPCAGVVGQAVTTTEVTLAAAGYTVTATPVITTLVPANQITECTATGTSVALTFAEPPPLPTCPAVAGQTVAQATPALTAAGFTDITTVAQASETVAEDLIISCTAADTEATLAVSTGPAPTEVTIPDLVGRSQEVATSALTTLGLTVSVSPDDDSDEPAGTVLSTTPGEGVTVPVGSAVTLVVSEGPDPVAVPGVVGQRQARAVRNVEGAGLTASIEREFTLDLGLIGRVIRTSPAADTEVAPGTPVVLVVGALSP